jgi:hypothetical protein
LVGQAPGRQQGDEGGLAGRALDDAAAATVLAAEQELGSILRISRYLRTEINRGRIQVGNTK